MLRLLSPAIVPLLLATAAYLASPIVAAQMLQRAIAGGDIAAIEARVDWMELRASLKRSLKARVAESVSARPQQQSFLSRISYKVQDAVAPGMIDRVIERDATPEGFVRYFNAPAPESPRRLVLRGWRTTSAGVLPAPRDPEPPSMLSRISWAAFLSPTRFAFEVADRHDPGRRYLAELELGAGFWTLRRVEVLSLGTSLGP